MSISTIFPRLTAQPMTGMPPAAAASPAGGGW
jgi:hypothetical protein